MLDEMDQDDDENDDADSSFNMANNLASNYYKEQEKSYTLTIISDPLESGAHKHYENYKKFL